MVFTVVAVTATLLASVSFGVVLAKKSSRKRDWLDQLEAQRQPIRSDD
jgi:hypothetical protein